MRTSKRRLSRLALGAALLLVPSSYALSQGDSSSDAPDGFVHEVENSTAVMIRVPIDKSGNEDTNAAQLRLYTGQPMTAGADLSTAWSRAVDVSGQPVVSDTSTSADSSTNWGWRNWYGYGWRNAYYYNSYQPYYNYYGNYYNYYRPYYYNSYYSYPYYNYYGYRYYYYPRYW